MTEPLARMACNAVDIGEREPIRSALDALRRHRPLPAGMTTAADVMAHLEQQLDLPPLRPGARWSAPYRARIESAVQAVFVAADPDAVMNPLRLLDLVKQATGASGEAVVRQICMDLGYS
jgi:hypothetical protein